MICTVLWYADSDFLGLGTIDLAGKGALNEQKMRGVFIELVAVLVRLETAQRKAGLPPIDLRADRLRRAIGVLLNKKTQLQDMLIADFGHRLRDLTNKYGFLNFSHQKAIYRQILLVLLKFLRPPYAGTFPKSVNFNLKNWAPYS